MSWQHHSVWSIFQLLQQTKLGGVSVGPVAAQPTCFLPSLLLQHVLCCQVNFPFTYPQTADSLRCIFQVWGPAQQTCQTFTICLNNKIELITEGCVMYLSCWCCCCFIHCHLKGRFLWVAEVGFVLLWWAGSCLFGGCYWGFFKNRILTPTFLKQLKEIFSDFSEKITR